MANIVLIIGDSGTGKSASLRNFKPDELVVINCAGKPLPFKNHFQQITPTFERLTKDVQKALATTDKKVVVIDDAQYIMSFQYMRRIKENGWDKWNDIQGDFFNIIQDAKNLPNDVVVYFLSHLQRDDAGHEKVKTMGKMLDEKITIEGLFTIVLKTLVADGQYYFLTQNSGLDTVKSPIGMFDTYAIDNDLKYVDTKIRNYYEIGNFASDEDVKALDAEVAHPEVEKPAADGKKRRRRRSSEPKADDSGSMVEKTPAETEDRTTIERKVRNGEKEEEKPAEAPAEEAQEEAEGTAAEEPVKQRRRKARTEGADSLETAMNVPEGETPADAPKKRRRRRTEGLTGNPFEDIPDDIPDDAVPFN